MLETFETSSKPEPYVAIFSPLEQPQQDVRQPALLPPSEFDSTGNDHSPIGTAGEPAVAPDMPASAVAPAKRRRRAWAPSADDHLIYRWVRLEGKGQEWAAQCFGISQSTVSRIVERYERWQAHAEARDDGRLDPAERLRAQRWLTFERNEQMLASCLRLAGEMEGCQDVSRTVKSRPVSSPSAESTLRTEWSVMDRTGMAARFLRLAFRINLEQLKLAEAAPAPLPEPLSEEEVAEQEAQATEERAEIAAVRERTERELQATQVSLMDQLAAAQQELAEARRDAIQARAEAEAARREAAAKSRPLTPSGASSAEDSGSQRDLLTSKETVCDAAPSRREGATLPELQMHNVHNLHTGFGLETGASACADDVCDAPRSETEFRNPGLHDLSQQRALQQSVRHEGGG